MFCIKCGTKLEEGDRFCFSCGAMVMPQDNPVASSPVASESAGDETLASDPVMSEATSAETVSPETAMPEAAVSGTISAGPADTESAAEKFMPETPEKEVAADPLVSGWGAAPTSPATGWGAAPSSPTAGWGSAPASPAPGWGSAPASPAPGWGSAPAAPTAGWSAPADSTENTGKIEKTENTENTENLGLSTEKNETPADPWKIGGSGEDEDKTVALFEEEEEPDFLIPEPDYMRAASKPAEQKEEKAEEPKAEEPEEPKEPEEKPEEPNAGEPEEKAEEQKVEEPADPWKIPAAVVSGDDEDKTVALIEEEEHTAELSEEEELTFPELNAEPKAEEPEEKPEEQKAEEPEEKPEEQKTDEPEEKSEEPKAEKPEEPNAGEPEDKAEEQKTEEPEPEKEEKIEENTIEQPPRVTELARKYKENRDEEAYEMLYQMEASNVYAWACMSGSKESAQEIMTETFLGVREKIDQLESPESFESWLKTLTQNEAAKKAGSGTSSTQDADIGKGADAYICEPEVAMAVWEKIAEEMAKPGMPVFPAEKPDENAAPVSSALPQSVPAAEEPVQAETNFGWSQTGNPAEGFSAGMTQPGYETGSVQSMGADQNTGAKTNKGLSVGLKVVLIIAAILVAFGIGFVAFLGFRFLNNKLAQKKDNRTTFADSNSDGEDSAAVAENTEDGQAEDGDQTGVAEGQVEDPEQYWDELPESKRENLLCVFSSLCNAHGLAESAFSMNETPDRSMADPVLESEEGLEMYAYYLVSASGFGVTEDRDGQRVTVISEDEMDSLLSDTVGKSFSAPAIQTEYFGFSEGLKKQSSDKIYFSIRYQDGNYILYPSESGSFTFANVISAKRSTTDGLRIFGTVGEAYCLVPDKQAEVEKSFTTGCMYNDNGYLLAAPDDADGVETVRNVFSFSARAKIDQNSPCGFTILGITYNDPESARIASDAGYALSFEDAQLADAMEGFPDDFYILPDSGTRLLTEDDIVGLDADMLRIARNEIYARHGRKFQDEMLQDYFNAMSWYRGTIEPDEFTDNMLNDIERKNADFIKKAEDKLKN